MGKLTFTKTKPAFVSDAGVPFPSRAPDYYAGFSMGCEFMPPEVLADPELRKKGWKKCMCKKIFYWYALDDNHRAGSTTYYGKHNPLGWKRGTSYRWKSPAP